MGRYLERAENCSRQLQVTSGFFLELSNLDPRRARQEWEHLAHCFPVPGGHKIKVTKKGDLALTHLNHFMLNPSNDVSVLSSVSNARDCAKAVSEKLTREVVFNLNEAHRVLKFRSDHPFRDKGRAFESVAATNRNMLTILGAIENTQTRDQGWWYHKLGEAIERTRRTLIVLGARLPALEQLSTETSSPLHYAGWRCLLSNLASLENYRQIHGPQFRSENVVRFLVFNPGAPRSVMCGALRMQGYIGSMPAGSSGMESARKEIGRFVSMLQYDDVRIMSEKNLKKFVPAALATLARIHEAVSDPNLEL